MTTRDYPYIRAWGRYMGSFAYYVTDQLERARNDNAPADAIYRDSSGRWVTFSEIETDAPCYNLVKTFADSIR